ncbi:hypothetical protein RI367_003810 [Sorochytrium milnesiophthora]
MLVPLVRSLSPPRPHIVAQSQSLIRLLNQGLTETAAILSWQRPVLSFVLLAAWVTVCLYARSIFVLAPHVAAMTLLAATYKARNTLIKSDVDIPQQQLHLRSTVRDLHTLLATVQEGLAVAKAPLPLLTWADEISTLRLFNFLLVSYPVWIVLNLLLPVNYVVCLLGVIVLCWRCPLLLAVRHMLPSYAEALDYVQLPVKSVLDLQPHQLRFDSHALRSRLRHRRQRLHQHWIGAATQPAVPPPAVISYARVFSISFTVVEYEQYRFSQGYTPVGEITAAVSNILTGFPYAQRHSIALPSASPHEQYHQQRSHTRAFLPLITSTDGLNEQQVALFNRALKSLRSPADSAADLGAVIAEAQAEQDNTTIPIRHHGQCSWAWTWADEDWACAAPHEASSDGWEYYNSNNSWGAPTWRRNKYRRRHWTRTAALTMTTTVTA